MTLQELIKDLEVATAPHSTLDGRIYCAMNRLTFRSVGKNGSIHFEPMHDGVHTMVTPHPYTSSVDLAFELVPEDVSVMVQRSDNDPHCALVGRDSKLPGGPSSYRGNGATAAIALCIAALKRFADVHGEIAKEPQDGR